MPQPLSTLSEIRADCRAHLNEAQAGYWTDEELDRWIAEATRDIARRAEIIMDVASVNLRNGQVAYDLPLDLLRIHRVEYRQSTSTAIALEYRPFLAMDDVWWDGREQTGYPSWYTIWGTPGIAGSQLYLYPVPSTDTQDGLRIFYYRLPKPPLQDSDPIELPTGWHDLVVLYAESVALRKGGSPRWQEARELYENSLGEMVRNTRQWTDQASRITGAEMLEGWLGRWSP